MKRPLVLLLTLLLLTPLAASCAKRAQQSDESGYALYYLADADSAGGGDAIAAAQTRYEPDETPSTEECARALVERLLTQPEEAALHPPVPDGTALQSLVISGRRARLDFSAQYGRLSGIELSLADYCITLTLTQLPDVNAVSITANGRELPYRRMQVLLAEDTLLLSRESGLRPITVSLYFYDASSGELRAEQQTLALYEGQTRVNAVLEALAQGPEDDALQTLLPEDFSVLSSRIEDGVCYVNLAGDAPLPEDWAQRELLFDAIEYSLLSIGGVKQVQLLVEGESSPRTVVSDAAQR